MKKHKLLIANILILIVIIFSYKLTEFILELNNLAFTHYVFYPFIVVCFILSVITVIQVIIALYKTASRKEAKKFARFISGLVGVIVILSFIVTLFYAPILMAMRYYKPAHIVEKNGEKMVAYVDGFVQVTISYYDYKNVFVRGKQLKIYEDCGNGSYDPFENGTIPYVHRATYYDDNGKVIKRYNRLTDGEYQ